MLSNDTYLAFLFKIIFILYTDSQSRPTWKNHTLHISVPAGVGIYIHISVQVDTNNLRTCDFWSTYDVISFIFYHNLAMQIIQFHENHGVKN